MTAKTVLGPKKGASSERPASNKSSTDTDPCLQKLSLSSEVTSCIIGGDICIESIDLLKFYHQKTHSLKVAVRVIDPKHKPISMAEVTLVTESLGGQNHPLKRLTDEDSVVSFEMSNPARGEWNVRVIGVCYPLYGSESYNMFAVPLTTHV
ncbi:MAG: hypothetical protein ACXADC_11425 [Candidatus Thorarchaeota archaeon]